MSDQKRIIEHAQNDMAAIGSNAAGPQGRSVWERLKDYLIDKVAPEVGEMLSHKIAQGSAEIAQAINSQADGFVPYGTGQKPLEVEGPGMSYQEMLKEAAARQSSQNEQGMER